VNIEKMRNGGSNRPSSARNDNGLKEMLPLPTLQSNNTNTGIGHLRNAFQQPSNRLQFKHLILNNSVKAVWRGWALLVLVLLLPLGPFLGITLARDIEIFD